MSRENAPYALALYTEAFYAQENGDIETAIKLYKQASRLGSTSAQINLGNIYDDVLTPAQPLKAVKMYRQVVSRGDPAGAWNLAIHYRNLGRDRWYHYWLRRAAEMGEADALKEVGRLTGARSKSQPSIRK